MKKVIRFILGLIIIPFLYIRYSFVLFLPFFFIGQISFEMFFVIWFIYALLFGFIMGNCGVMKHLTKLFQWILGIKYKIKGRWLYNNIASYSVWSHPIIQVREKEYRLSIAVMGGNLYDEEAILNRKAIFYWLLN